MAVRRDVPGFASPAIDARVDVTDQYVFPAPGDPSKMVLITNVNPLAPTHADEFRSDAVYETLIDTDGDAEPDIALRCRFSRKSNGRQLAHVTRAVLTIPLEDGHIHEELETETLIDDAPVSFGDEPVVTEGSDGVRFFAGFRSDPFFFDLSAYLDGFNFRGPGTDFFVDKNVFGIAIEVPNRLLGGGQKIGVWARTVVPMTWQRDHFTQFDQVGGPLVSMFFNHGTDHTTFTRTEPARQRTATTASGDTFLRSFTSKLETTGGYDPEQAEEIAKRLLPDILVFDRSSPPGYPNGRRLQDDVADFMLGLLTNGAVNTDHVGPQTDHLPEFPYLGHPRRGHATSGQETAFDWRRRAAMTRRSPRSGGPALH